MIGLGMKTDWTGGNTCDGDWGARDSVLLWMR